MGAEDTLKNLHCTKRWTRKKKELYMSALCRMAWDRCLAGNYKDDEEEDYLLLHGVHMPGRIEDTEKRLLRIGVHLPWKARKPKPSSVKKPKSSTPTRLSPRIQRMSRRRSLRSRK